MWHILAPYLINIRKCSADEAFNTIRDWLDKCSQLRRLDFNPNYMIKYIILILQRGWLSIDKFGEVKDRVLLFV